MKTISKYYNYICTSKYQCLGFKKNKMTFARIRGDVLQSFTLKCFQRVPVCSIEFGVFPLCMPTPIFIEAGGYKLDKFIVEIHEKYSGWPFEFKSENSIKDCINSVSQAIDAYLLPFFEACYDCNSSLYELISLEKIFDSNRQKVLNIRGEYDSAIPWEDRSLFDSRKYYMALKAQNFSYAQKFLQNQISFYEKKLHLFDNNALPKQPESVKEGFGVQLSLYSNQLEQLEIRNFSYFTELLCANEKNMLTYISAKYPNILRT